MSKYQVTSLLQYTKSNEQDRRIVAAQPVIGTEERGCYFSFLYIKLFSINLLNSICLLNIDSFLYIGFNCVRRIMNETSIDSIACSIAPLSVKQSNSSI